MCHLGHFANIYDRFPAISSQFPVIFGRFPTISIREFTIFGKNLSGNDDRIFYFRYAFNILGVSLEAYI